MNEITWHESAIGFLLHRNCFLLINMRDQYEVLWGRVQQY